MKFHWRNVIACYVLMAMAGASCWLYCNWTFRGIWKGAVAGVGLFTVFILWICAEELYFKLKSKYSWLSKCKNPSKSK